MLLENKVVVVTGGSRGIGRAIALASAREGADVAINYWGDNDRSYGKASAVESIVGEIEALGRRAIAVEGNVAERDTGIELVRRTVDAFGHVDVLSSNAGICPFHAFLDMPAIRLRDDCRGEPERRVLRDAGRREPDEDAGHGRRDRRDEFDQRARRRRHADALHADQGGRALADAVLRDRARARMASAATR